MWDDPRKKALKEIFGDFGCHPMELECTILGYHDHRDVLFDSVNRIRCGVGLTPYVLHVIIFYMLSECLQR
jgi:hypothetical protein